MTKNLNHRCRRPLNRKLGRLLTRRTNGRPFRRTDYLAQVCRAVNDLLKHNREMARKDPHLFGPHADRYLIDTFREARREAEWESVLNKVYGPAQPGNSPLPPGVWTRRYVRDPAWKGFRKWFRQAYG